MHYSPQAGQTTRDGLIAHQTCTFASRLQYALKASIYAAFAAAADAPG